jgi:hypothetical protein
MDILQPTNPSIATYLRRGIHEIEFQKVFDSKRFEK